MRRLRQKGYVFATLPILIILLLGAAGLAIDIGHLFSVRSELQVYADAASIAATQQLDGTSAGIARAQAASFSLANKWNFANQAIGTQSVTFAKTALGPWEEAPADPRSYGYSRVSTTVSVPLFFMPFFMSNSSSGTIGTSAFFVYNPTMNVSADSGAGQIKKTWFSEGLFPFSPFAHSASAAPHFGLVLGQKYTLRWAATPKLNNKNVCAGDNDLTTITLAQAGGGEERGFIENSSSDILRAAIEDDYQSVTRAIGDSVVMTGGAKQTQLTSLLNRIGTDTDSTSATYADYVQKATGNGRRIVAAPVNLGSPTYQIVQIGAFLLLPASEYGSGGNQAFCAEYLGAWVQGSRNKGAGDGGAYVVRLIR